ncbi:ATP-dependent DNA helicase [Erysipelotrichaceae bacterium]|nr:ATP-dependent DNA helicase [Erysipelotrichaceae bacterium]
MLDAAHKILHTYFGYNTFREGQTEIVSALLNKQDVLAIMPTGAGKSICYQVPAMLFEGLTLVISPLISLMQDQVHALNQVGIAAAFLNSSLSIEKQNQVLADTKNNAYTLLYIAPEQLLTQRFLLLSKEITISFISIDEAHCISQWGHDFRPGYLRVTDYINQLPTRPIIGAFTATATKIVKADITQILNLDDPFSITTGFDRPNLSFSVHKTNNTFNEIKAYLAQKHGLSGIIYCSTRVAVESIHAQLLESNYAATLYHAGLLAETKLANQHAFVRDEVPIIVATNAFGMGIDKSNVSFVIHHNMPKNIESYYQEAGRAGRDGSPAQCLLFYSGSDVRTNQFFLDTMEQGENTSDVQFLEFKAFEQERLKKMTFFCYTEDCLRHYILAYFGENTASYCGNCSNCLDNFEQYDVTIPAQKILSCIKRMGENFGIKMVVDVLRGSKNSRLLTLRLNEQKTYDILADTSETQIRHIIQQLLVLGYLITTNGQYPTLKLTSMSLELLLGKSTLSMNIPKNIPLPQKNKSQTITFANPELFSILQKLRQTLAKKQNIPAYLIFSNATLNEICQKRPATLEQMATINGIGKIKLEQYGRLFLDILSDYEH